MTGETDRTGQAAFCRSREANEERAGRWLPQRALCLQQAPQLGGLCLAVILSAIATPAATADSSVFVNEALLDGITQQAVPVMPYNAQATYGGQPGFSSTGPSTTIVGTNQDGSQYYVTRPSTLLFPPPRFPRSRVTVIDSATASSGGTSYSFNAPTVGSNAASTQAAARLAPPSSTTNSGQKAESRLLVPLPPNIAQQAAVPKAPAVKRSSAKAQAVPRPPKQVAKSAETPKAPPPPRQAAPASTKTAAVAPAPKAPAPKAPAPKAPAPKVTAAPPPPKIAPKPLVTPAAPKTTSLAAAPAPKAPVASQLTANQLAETTASLTPPPPPPPVAPSGNNTTAQPQQQAATQAPVQDTPDPAPSQQSASRGDASAQVSEVQLLFSANDAALSGASKSALETVAQSMLADESSEIQLFAYAGQTGSDATQARRLSLSRAMAVRAFLIGKGIRPARMQVRALGNKTTSGSPDRVDVVPAKR